MNKNVFASTFRVMPSTGSIMMCYFSGAWKEITTVVALEMYPYHMACLKNQLQ